MDDHPPSVEVDVLPAQRQQLAEAQAGVGGETEQLGVLGVLSHSPGNLVGFDVRGLMVNAIAHADYSRAGETIKVFVFDDRIEIVNPGPMLPGLTTEDIRNGRSKIRNRGIASVLRRVRYMEQFGTAWEKIEAETADGYPEPGFDGDGPLFCATLWPHPSFAGSGILPSRQSGEISGGITSEINGGITALGKGDVARRCRSILAELAQEGG